MKTKHILEKVYVAHAPAIANWALQQLKNTEDAEDLCQEVLTRFAKILVAKEANGEEIEDIEKYLWSIAHNLVKDFYNVDKKKERLAQRLENDATIDYIGDGPVSPDSTDTQLQKLRKSISSLVYNLREAMIMYHLEKKSLAEIGQKLGVTETYVKKLLAEAKHKIRENDRKGLYNPDQKYRASRVRMGISGHIEEAYSHQQILDSLSKQNICLACYERPCSIEELSLQLGFPSEYIEYDVQRLLEGGFLKRLKNRYSTMFFIHDGTFQARLVNTHYINKAKCHDIILDKLTALDSRIKAIGFKGSERPINQLLWLLIYTFILQSVGETHNEVHGSRFEYINKATGERHFKNGSFDNDSRIPFEPGLAEKYIEIFKWEENGPITNNDEPDAPDHYSWFWLRKGENYRHIKSITGMPLLPMFKYIHFLCKVCQPNFKIDNLTDDERFTLSKCVGLGLLSLTAPDSITPNFYVFTSAQREQFDKLLLECWHEVKGEMRELYLDLQKMCKAALPKQLDGSVDFVSYISLVSLCFYLTVFAYYDGRLFIPKDTDEYTLQTLNITIRN